MEKFVILRDRRFSGAMVRGICDHVHGSHVSRNAWGNWRTWAGVRADTRSYTFEQFCFLFAIASIRSKEEDKYRQLYKGEIEKIAESPETENTIGDFVRFFDSQYVVGKDAPRRLAHDGVKVSARTLYRNVPGFNMNKIYRVEQLREWAIA